VVERMLRWFDDRLGTSHFARSALNKIFPDNWSFMLGEIAFYCFIVLVLTGTYITFFFHPSAQDAVYHGSYAPLRGLHMSAAYESAIHLSFDVRAGLVRRAYSSRPVEYPSSGTKPLRGNTGDWFETVFTRREVFVANTIGEIAKVFPDHELIGSMGLGSVVNLPIVLEGELVATINLLDAAGHYTPEKVEAARSGLAIPARLCCALALRFEPMTSSSPT